MVLGHNNQRKEMQMLEEFQAYPVHASYHLDLMGCTVYRSVSVTVIPTNFDALRVG